MTNSANTINPDRGARLKIKQLLGKRIGLNPDSIGDKAIARAIDQRLHLLGIENPHKDTRYYQYYQLLLTSATEFEALVECVIIPETYFFRGRQSFTFLERYVRQEWLPKHSHRSLRVLSVPCSTGEEPYSIAITLAKAGLSPERVQIEAIDISRQSLVKAERAIYTDYSFRQQFLTDRQAYFHQVPEGYQLCNSMRRCVKFEHSNLLDPWFALERQPYDLIFCRNLLIYFHAAARTKATQVLDQLLIDQGLLFVGYAETTQIDHRKFVSVGHSLTFAYQKAQRAKKASATSPRPAHKNRDRLLDAPSPILKSKTAQPATNLANKTKKEQLVKSTALDDRIAEPKSDPNDQADNLLQTARSLADVGQLAAAAELCQAYLSQNPICAHAYVLYGEILQAIGKDEQAEECWQKALYLQPDYYEALVHLALLKEQRGDRLGAAVIFQRICVNVRFGSE
ncbi:MCP methyltransferase, CheR-type with Tpr repeats [Thalassoporum mexicanum PCC 7367]|uniref:CheR family methyltransferase n=1 Tax=Thalassoporum mexicanum TaxID=3457544 RepID=UPI00029FEC62|nr:protein-glutamate O-methyltransferase CheR [Pseudanabaena sp. PCC 7367]AFY71606.1 MCP methyltransferase, CheR-type with Tpr repeats [Pseudanabaena sp. PCC 7367]